MEDSIYNNDLGSVRNFLISGSLLTLESVTIKSGQLYTYQFSFSDAPNGYFDEPFYLYTRSTGWSGVIQQGLVILPQTKNICIMYYNSTSVDRTITPNIELLYYKK